MGQSRLFLLRTLRSLDFCTALQQMASLLSVCCSVLQSTGEAASGNWDSLGEVVERSWITHFTSLWNKKLLEDYSVFVVKQRHTTSLPPTAIRLADSHTNSRWAMSALGLTKLILLFLNSDKSDVIVLHSKNIRDLVSNQMITLDDISWSFCSTVRNLVAVFDQDVCTLNVFQGVLSFFCAVSLPFKVYHRTK